MQTFQVNNLPNVLIRPFTTNGAHYLSDMYDRAFTPTVNQRYFKAVGGKYIPAHYLPTSINNMDRNIGTGHGIFHNRNQAKHIQKYLPVINKLMSEKGINIKNATWWKNILTGVTSNLCGWTAQDLEDTARATYEEVDISFSTGEINRRNFMAPASNIEVRSCSMHTSNSVVEHMQYCPSGRENWLNSAGNGFAYGGVSNLLYGSRNTPYNQCPIAFCVMLKSEHFQDWLAAYESQVFTTKIANMVSWKSTFNRRLYGGNWNPIKTVKFDPKWFTVVYVEDLYNKIKDLLSENRHIVEYKAVIIDAALEFGMDIDTSVMSYDDISSPIQTDIKSHLTTGLSNYAEESREFLTTLSRIKQR